MSDKDLLALWGKTDRKDKTQQNFHPLLFHLLDVQHCALELWKSLPKTLKTQFAHALDLDEDATGKLLALLAGLHDLGKATPNFQQKAPFLIETWDSDILDFPDYNTKHPHNFLSVPETTRLLQTTELFPFGLNKETAKLLSAILGAHHGTFPKSSDIHPSNGSDTERLWVVFGKNAAWSEARDLLAERLYRALGEFVLTESEKRDAVCRNRTFAPLLAAFISLADWFGSSRYFEIDGIREYQGYLKTSRDSAEKAIRESGWRMPATAGGERKFAELFPFEPNALQSKVIELLEQFPSPALWIIEEEMGEGKTEAAYTVFDRAHTAQYAEGLYIAMPTQATSNAMYDRLEKFLLKRYPKEHLNLILAHSHAYLDEQYQKRMEAAEKFNTRIYNEIQQEGNHTAEDDSEAGAVIVSSWFTARKQTLLTQFGVGTIDQALLGVLQTRHWFVRLYGLTGKVVVFDEVHAYDAYMNTLLMRLIQWLAELGCTVVLLSATLPTKTRLQLATAYRGGAKSELEAAETPQYPRITVVPQSKEAKAEAFGIEKPGTAPKSVTLEHLANTPEAVKEALLEAVPGAGCGIVICNTVTRAQEMYAKLSKFLEGTDWNCLLFHARMPFAWRKKREEQVLELFGKTSGEDGTVPRHLTYKDGKLVKGNTLLISTQVCEQSLDLDADWMASELAPVDLILQRMGRLWRHKFNGLPRARTASECRFALLCDVPEIGGIPTLGVSEYVYAPHTLLRSWLALRDATTVTAPDDIEPLVQAVYDAADPIDLSEEWTSALSNAVERYKNKNNAQRAHAKAVTVSLPNSDDTFADWIAKFEPALADDDDPALHEALRAVTRDGDPSLTLICCGTDTDGDALAPDPTGKITLKTVREMMAFSLPVSLKAIYHALKNDKPPKNWQDNAHLKYCRRIVFAHGIATIGKKKVTLSQAKGLEVEGGVQAEAEE